jgi:protein-tyrosine kinase
MENIRQALERARERSADRVGKKEPDGSLLPRELDAKIGANPVAERGRDQQPEQVQQVALDPGHLESNRIIAHNEADYRSRAFDMLRTQVLQAMDQKNWKILGITSPSPGCGKTLMGINLALSIARQPDRSVLLVELDLQRPQIAKYLGIKCRSGIVSVLADRSSLSSAMVHALVGSSRIIVLPAETSTSDSSAWMTSRPMNAMLQNLKRDYPSHIVVVDLPPMLSTDDAISVLPRLDCLLLVAAVGRTTTAEMEECNRHLRSADVVRIVLNKVPELNAQYYGYYGLSAERV